MGFTYDHTEMSMREGRPATAPIWPYLHEKKPTATSILLFPPIALSFKPKSNLSSQLRFSEIQAEHTNLPNLPNILPN